MISLGLTNKPEDQRRKKTSAREQGTKVLYLPGDLSVRIGYPPDLQPDILSAVEIIVLIVVPAFAQQGQNVHLARLQLVKSNVRIALYGKKEGLIKEYEYPVQSLLDAVKEARSRLFASEGSKDLIAKAFEDLEASQE